MMGPTFVLGKNDDHFSFPDNSREETKSTTEGFSNFKLTQVVSRSQDLNSDLCGLNTDLYVFKVYASS